VPIAALVAECQQLIAAGCMPAAAEVAVKLEAARPLNEADWQSLSNVFDTLNKTAANRLMCERFLTIEPENATAQLWLARVLSQNNRLRDRATLLTNALAARSDLTEDQSLKLADIYKISHFHDQALGLYRQLSAAYPASLTVQLQLTRILPFMGRFAEAKIELGRLRAMMPQNNVGWHVNCAEIAAQANDKATLIACGDAAAAILTTRMNPLLLDRLLRCYVRLGERKRAEQTMRDIDYQAINIAADAAKLVTVAEANGFMQAAVFASRRLVELNPQDSLAAAKLTSLEVTERWFNPAHKTNLG
jgi:predicted Zn-dependent protease